MPRVRVEGGRFVQGPASQPFTPRGFNFIRLDPRWHSTFHPDRYDAEAAGDALGHMAERGFNVVRVFIDPFTGRGVVASDDAEELSPKYVEHVCDFLAKAQAHRVYVLLSMLHLPEAGRYRPAAPTAPSVGARNRHLLDRAWIEAKARYMGDFVAAIKHHDPALLAAVFAYETDNELHLDATQPPFSLTEGKIIGANGRAYDAADIAQLQQMADDHTVVQTNACVEAVRAVDPRAMVSVNVFTFAAVGRTGPGRWRTDGSKDRRFPARPLALVRSLIDYLDIHFYALTESGLEADLASVEWPELTEAAARFGKPMIMGEFGAFTGPHRQLDAAVASVQAHVDRIEDLGFRGWLYWTYDTHEQNFIWHGRSASYGDAVFEALADRIDHANRAP